MKNRNLQIHRRLLLFVLLSAIPAFVFGQSASRVENVKFDSKLVGAPLPYNVVLPPDYDSPVSSRIVRYPVLYLLHGLTGSANDWVSNRAHLAQYAAQYRMLIVVPEGHDGWYTDSATVPNEKYERYIIQELIPDVERRFRALSTRESRAIAGLSMGGYGSLKFGLKYPDKFVFVGSMSGALPAASWDPADKDFPTFLKASIKQVYGPMDSPVRAANNIFKITNALSAAEISKLPYMYVSCGTEDFLISTNREFSDLLLKKKIPHEFRELPGEHSWPFWDNQVQVILQIAAARLSQPAPETTPLELK